MSNSIFLDTNGWLALLNNSDAMHDHADAVWRTIINDRRSIVLTDWIIAEAGNGLSRYHPKDHLSKALDRVIKVGTEIIYIDEILLHRAMKNFSRHSDKSWGLVD